MQCHTDQSFLNFIGKDRYDHRVTGFNLNGQHKTIDCFACHEETSNPELVFQDQVNTKEKNCASCHTDAHDGKLGKDCANCHKESSFLALGTMALFNHNITDFPLEGKHAGVDCKQCHTSRSRYDIDFSSCNNCHEDYHRGEFIKEEVSPDCDACHSLDKGFDYSLYTVEEHQITTFPLQGAHMATPCFACHLTEKRWTFRNLGSTCVNCHDDLHQGILDEKYYPENKCNSCHNEGAWSSIEFDHNLTEWTLDGKHLEVACRECHFEVENNTIINQTFKELESNCGSCHENVHEDMFAVNGVTDCSSCHVTGSWYPEKFDHNATLFPLEGRHAEIECNECHKIIVKNQITLVNYKIEKFECIDCHL